MNRIRTVRAMYLGLAVTPLILAACDGHSIGAQTDTAMQQTTAAPAVTDQVATTTTTTTMSAKYGRYVEPKTFAIGGLGTKFKTTDQLFAAVEIDAPKQKTDIQARLLDQDGSVLSDQTRQANAGKTGKVNFQLTRDVPQPLVAGKYQVELLMNGKTVRTDEITVE